MTMRAMRIASFGEANVLRGHEIEAPEAGPGEVVVEVKACGLNHLDLRVRRGEFPHLKLPLTPGTDIAGEVEGTGEKVVLYPIVSCGACKYCAAGREQVCREIRILGVHRDGGLAERIVVPRGNAIRVSDAFEISEWAATPVSFLTAYHALVGRANLRVGETILVHSGGSGLGSAAIQIAHAGGAHVIATASTNDKLERAKRFGADETINYREIDFAEAVFDLTKGEGVDVILDHVGGPTLEASISCLSRLGRLVACGETGYPSASVALRPFFNRERTMLGAYLGSRREFLNVLALLERKTVKPVVDATFPLDRAVEAHEYLEGRHAFGKVVLTL